MNTGRTERTPRRIQTGSGIHRRPLTLAEAEAGGLPEPFTATEWKQLAYASFAPTLPPFAPSQPARRDQRARPL